MLSRASNNEKQTLREVAMQRIRVTRQIAITVALGAGILGVWYFGAWLGDNLPVWGIFVVLGAIFVFFLAELWDA
jgi:fatty acid desaturase